MNQILNPTPPPPSTTSSRGNSSRDTRTRRGTRAVSSSSIARPDRLEHRTFRDLVEIVRPGDALVLNETRVFPARLVGRRASGAEAEVLLLEPVEIDRDGRVLPRIDGADPGTGTLEALTAARTYAAAADGAGPDGARDHEARGPTLGAPSSAPAPSFALAAPSPSPRTSMSRSSTSKPTAQGSFV